jgi:hypothetical protein
MMKIAALTVLICALVHPAGADSVPVSGTTTGAFLLTGGPTLGFGKGANASSLVYTPASFWLDGNTQSFSLGSITLNNGGYGGAARGLYRADLKIDVNFTAPASGYVTFLDTLDLQLVNGSHGFDVLFSGLPGSQSFSAGGRQYVVTFDGLFDAESGGSEITEVGLSTANSRGRRPENSGTAYFRATIQSEASSLERLFTAIPEPTSFALLLTAVAGLVLFLAQRKLRRHK